MPFTPRLTADGIYQDEKWYSAGNIYYPSYQMPNCTCYAYGRFWEILGQNPNLASGNAEDWWGNINNYQKSQTPQLGAIACWNGGAAYDGHVAIVEAITDTGITTSNSGYHRPIFAYPPDTPQYFWTEECLFSSGTRSSWMVSRGYTFQGYILNPGSEPPEWIYGNRYLSQDEMTNNAYCFYYAMSGYGFSLNAIAGMLGNIQKESGINPGIWQDLNPNPANGFGLVQWTPSSVYTTWADSHGYDHSDGDGQCEWIANETGPEGQWIVTTGYPMTWEEFRTSEEDVSLLAATFEYNFERPLDPESTLAERQQYARHWLSVLQNTPTPPRPNKPIPDWDANTWIQYGAIAETLRKRRIIR